MTNKEAAIGIINTLRDNGHQALFAGGCVRDMLLNRTAKDYDIATSAHPEQVRKLFRRTLEIGAQFGVIMVMVNADQIEVATFRTEAGYADGRHPSEVTFSDAKHDASRRDFTINGMFYDPAADEVLDYVDGQSDLKAKVLRTIGDPNQRFDEDYLRMLRAVRFSTQLGFEIDSATWDAVITNANKITGISGERIAMEIEKILTNSARITGMKLLVDSQLAEVIFPKYTGQKVDYSFNVLNNLPENISLPLAMSSVFAAFSPKEVLSQLKVLKLSNAHLKNIEFLLENRGSLLNADMSLAELKKLMATPYFDDLCDFQCAIQKADGDSTESLSIVKSRAKKLESIDISPKPLLDGHRLIKIGVKPGPMVGQASKEMYKEQLNETLKTTEQAVKWVENWLKKNANND